MLRIRLFFHANHLTVTLRQFSNAGSVYDDNAAQINQVDADLRRLVVARPLNDPAVPQVVVAVHHCTSATYSFVYFQEINFND